MPEDLFEGIQEICDSYKIKTLSDHIYTASGDAYLSWSSIYSPEYGTGIIAHELGHFVSRSLKASDPSKFDFPLWVERGCVASFHPTVGRYQQPWLNNYQFEPQYTEEDGADRFAAKLLAKSPHLPQHNFACSLQRTVNDSYVIDLANGNVGLNHSSNFFRAIHAEYALKQRLPKSCQPFQARVSCDGWGFN